MKKTYFFVRLPDAMSRERNHDNRKIGLCCEEGFFLIKLEEKGNAFYAPLIEFGCLQ